MRWIIADESESPAGTEDSPPNDQFVHVVTSILLGIGVLLVVLAAVAAAGTYRGLAREEPAPGRVVTMTVRLDPNDNEYHFPVVEFSLPDGTLKRVQLPEGSWPPAYEVGEEVLVKYDSTKPLNARIESTTGTIHLWTWTIILGALGLAFLIITSFVRWVFSLSE